MDALLILSGLICLIAGWIWLILSARRLPSPALLIASLLPVATLFMRKGGYRLLPRALFALGLLLILAGVGYLHQHDPDRFDLLMSGSWAGLGEPEQALSGQIAGQRFAPDRVLWRNDQLLFEEGPPGRVRRSLAIRFDSAGALLVDEVIQKVPGEGAPWPELVLQWYQGAMEPPGLRTLSGPYSLSLRFSPSSDGRAPLFINLTLPDEQQTWLRGQSELSSLPPWLAVLRDTDRPAEPVARRAEPVQQERSSEPDWGELSVLALLDEPEPFIGSTLRLTTLSGRLHEGQLAGITDDRRIVLGQQRGANRVDFQFNPVDIARIERLSAR